jgi:hypothetical protein
MHLPLQPRTCPLPTFCHLHYLRCLHFLHFLHFLRYLRYLHFLRYLRYLHFLHFLQVHNLSTPTHVYLVAVLVATMNERMVTK